MTAYTLPAPDAPAEEWGRLAVSVPGWRWLDGMLLRFGQGVRHCDTTRYERHNGTPIEGSPWWPNPDDPATAGCLLALLGPDVNVLRRKCRTLATIITDDLDFGHYPQGRGHTLGRACIAAAAALGRWPGGEG